MEQPGAGNSSRRLRAVVRYGGDGYHGFQRQPNRPTVQGVLEERLSRFCGHPVAVTGAGRTDTGVHALGQVIHFDTTGRIPAERIEEAFNASGVRGVTLAAPEEVSTGFHARFSAQSRTYWYFISRYWPGPFEDRWVVRRGWLADDAAKRMGLALRSLEGTHDFAPFCAAEGREGNTRRTLLHSEVRERDGLLRVELTADAFLHNMVRIIVGQLVVIGQGHAAPNDLARALKENRRLAGSATAPARGLVLARVDYGDGYPGRDANGNEVLGPWPREWGAAAPAAMGRGEF